MKAEETSQDYDKVFANVTKEGEVYQYRDQMLMRCTGKPEIRFVDIHTGQCMRLCYDDIVIPLKQIQPAKFEFGKL